MKWYHASIQTNIYTQIYTYCIYNCITLFIRESSHTRRLVFSDMCTTCVNMYISHRCKFYQIVGRRRVYNHTVKRDDMI